MGKGSRGVPSCVDGGAEEPDPVAIGFGEGVGDGEAKRRWRSRRPSGRHRLWPGTGATASGDDVAASTVGSSRRYCAPVDRLGVRMSVGWRRHTVNLVICAAGPHLFLYSAVRRGPTSQRRAGAPPIRAPVRVGPSGPLGSEWAQEINLTVSPLISLCSFPFFSLSHFIIDLCIEHLSSSRSSADRLSSYDTRLHSETDASIFWAFYSPEITGYPLTPCRLRVP